MNFDFTLINYFLNAGLVVKTVMILLIVASIFSWTYIMQRYFYLALIKRRADKFENAFWDSQDISKLYHKENNHKPSQEGINAIFAAGFREYVNFLDTTNASSNQQAPHLQAPHLQKNDNANLTQVIDNTKRAMRAAQMRVQTHLETHLPFLAMVGTTSPYIGLFGTVWGIMQAFRALSSVSQATIAMVAPGIAEALIATALGLFAAIPAIIAYNRFVSDIGILMNRFDAFQEEFTNALTKHFILPAKGY